VERDREGELKPRQKESVESFEPSHDSPPRRRDGSYLNIM
jgi:hypothetical protein